MNVAVLDWHQIAELVKTASRLPHSSRHSFIAETCRDHPDAASHILSILAERDNHATRHRSNRHPTASAAEKRDVSLQFVEIADANTIRIASETFARTADGQSSIGPGERPNPIGTVLGRYLVKRALGSGGMGDVYLVQDIVRGHELALKTRHPAPEDSNEAELRLRFRHEFASMAKLAHPNIARVFDFGTFPDGTDYFTMEVVPGTGLDEFSRGQKLPAITLFKILRQLAEVLAFLHTRNIVHRDLKPSNLRLGHDGDVKVMDFGLAEPMGFRSAGISGTLAYICPEVIQGRPVDGRSDLYSLGVIAHRLATGTLPFAGRSTEELLKAHLNAPPPSVATMRPDLAGPFEQLVLALLEKNPANRFQNASEVLSKLAEVAGDKPPPQSIEKKKSYLYCAGLIGREAEVRELLEHLQKLRCTRGGCVFLAAPAGIGKSRLLQEFRLRCQLVVIPALVGQCREHAGGSYAPFAAVFKDLLALTPLNRRGQMELLVGHLLPEMDTTARSTQRGFGSLNEKLAAFTAIAGWIIELASRHPLVICFEDLHWADDATLELFQFCVNETKNTAVLFVGTYRDDEMSPASPLLQLADDQMARILSLAPLRRDDVPALITGMLGNVSLPSEFVDDVYHATAGNAFFVSEVVRQLIEDEVLQLQCGCWVVPETVPAEFLPTSIENTIRHRLRFLTPGARRLADRFAVAGEAMTFGELGELADLTFEPLAEHLEELLAHQFIEKVDQRYALRHDRVRETLYGDLADELKRDLHLRVATLIEARAKSEGSVAVADLAFHYQRTNNHAKAIQYSIRAGKLACARQLPLVGVRWLDDAVSLLDQHDYPDRKWILLDCFETICNNGLWIDNKLCARAATRLGAEVRNMTHPALVRRVLNLLCRICSKFPASLSQRINAFLVRPSSPFPVGRSRIRQWMEEHNYAANYARLIFAQSVYFAALPCIGEYAEGERMLAQILAEAPTHDSLLRAMMLFPTLCFYSCTGRQRTLRAEGESLIETWNRNRNRLDMRQQKVFATVIYMYLMHYVWKADRRSDPERHQLLEQVVQENQLAEYFAHGEFIRCLTSLMHGEHREYWKRRETVAYHVNRLGKPPYYTLWLLHGDIRAFLLAGRFDDALRLCRMYTQQADKSLKSLNDILNRSYILLFAGEAQMALGNATKALHQMDAAVAIALPNNLESLTACLEGATRVLARLGRFNEAEAAAQNCLERACSDEFGNPYWAAICTRSLGQVRLLQGRYEDAERLLREAWRKVAEMDNKLQCGLSCLALSELKQAQGDTTAARDFAGTASELFEQLGNEYLVKRARSAHAGASAHELVIRA